MRAPPDPDAQPGPWERDRLAGLPCRVLLPHDYQPARYRYPLVVFLHGSGERGDDNEAQLKLAVRGFNAPTVRARHPAIVVAPQAPSGGNWGGTWYGGHTPGQDAVLALTRELAGRSSVDEARVYLVGISMGAIGGWDLLARAPELFAAAVLVCGDPDPAIAGAIARVPVWAFHGDDDRAVLPDGDRALAAASAKLGGRVRYSELAGVGHAAWEPVFAAAATYDWLFAHARSDGDAAKTLV